MKFDFQMRQQLVGFMDENATVGEWNGLDWTGLQAGVKMD